MAKKLHKITHNAMTNRGSVLIGRSNKIGRGSPKEHQHKILSLGRISKKVHDDKYDDRHRVIIECD